MAQKAGAESAALVRPLDDAGNVGHDERFMVANLHDAQIGFERGEGIVGDLGFGGGNSREQRTLARIGKAHQSHVGQHLQFENESPFVALFARLGVARRLVGGAFEMPVAETSAAAMQQHQPFSVGGNLPHRLDGFRAVLLRDDPFRNRTQRHGNHDVLGVLARRTGARTALAVLGELVTLVFEVDQGPVLAVALQDDTAALAAVAAVGTAESHEFLAAEMRRAGSAVTRTGEYLYVIYKIRSCHNVPYWGAKTVQAGCKAKFIGLCRSAACLSRSLFAAKIVQAGRKNKSAGRTIAINASDNRI